MYVYLHICRTFARLQVATNLLSSIRGFFRQYTAIDRGNLPVVLFRDANAERDTPLVILLFSLFSRSGNVSREPNSAFARFAVDWMALSMEDA